MARLLAEKKQQAASDEGVAVAHRYLSTSFMM
jgi:hypothetical protein